MHAHLPHTLVIAAIFVPYMALMIGLGIYIHHTGQPRDEPRSEEEEQPERDRAEIRLAA